MACPARLALCGVPCGCDGRNPSHRLVAKPVAGDPGFPYMLADTPEEFERVRRIALPVAEVP